MEKIKIYLLFLLLPVGCSADEAPGPAEQDVCDLFDAEGFEEPVTDVVIRHTKKPMIALKDVPFYCKLLAAYLYEEKFQRAYLSLHRAMKRRLKAERFTHTNMRKK